MTAALAQHSAFYCAYQRFRQAERAGDIDRMLTALRAMLDAKGYPKATG